MHMVHISQLTAWLVTTKSRHGRQQPVTSPAEESYSQEEASEVLRLKRQACRQPVHSRGPAQPTVHTTAVAQSDAAQHDAHDRT